MAKIHVMDAHLANMIAAGEVIERPSSVIKELVENSIDAKAHHIEVDIYSAGRKKIVVKDDGEGMDEEDARLAFKRHASSKILDEYQLFKIKTMGFRGEALPSIAAVSKVTMYTSTGNSDGCKVTATEEELSLEPYQSIKGTVFEIEELFYNTPVRLKYLKSDATEIASCLEVMQRLALSFTNVAFDFYIEDKLSFSTSGRGDLLEVIARLYGNDIAKKMIKVNCSSFGFEVNGYIALPEITRSTRYYMITILNNRNVYLPQIQKSIISGYSDYIFNSKYPFAVLDIKVDYSLVDVNVHPSKKEVRLSNERELSTAVEELVRNSLKKINAVHEAKIPTKEVETVSLFQKNNNISDINIIRPTSVQKDIPITFKEPETSFEIDYEKYDETPKEDISDKKEEKIIVTNEVSSPKNDIPNFKIIGQIHNTYIILEGDNGFYLVDQHAANERINYERLNKLLNSKIEVCDLLVPLLINLSPSEIKKLTDDKITILKEIGLNIESFGLNTIKISSIPVFIKEANEEDYIEELINQVIKDDKINLELLRKHVIATMACKASIKANDKLSQLEMESLISTLFTCKNPTCCPHGRPTIIHFSTYDIEKMFKRSGI